ncbi:MAG: alanine racemase [Armatimonadetes bacterium]|nr:alanine racemase [Armatimonadota bacterium]
MVRPTHAEINLSAIEFNLAQVREIVEPGVRICPAVKADAYGHGAVQVSRLLVEAGVEMLGVAFVEEAVELRDAGIGVPILLLQPAFAEQIPEIVRHDLAPTVCDIEFARELSRRASGKPVKVHLKVDTGMGRVGIQPEDTPAFAAELAGLPGVELEGIFTHFPTADEEDLSFTHQQIWEFARIIEAVQAEGVHIPLRHAANSAGLLNCPNSCFNMVRPGIMLYGLYDSPFVSREVELRQALTLKSRIAFLKELPPGRTVGYGRTYTTTRRTIVATIPIGYADGYNRRLSNRGHALVRGARVPIIGRVCMDQIMLDVTDVPGASVGDEVVLYGRQGDQEISMEETEEIVGTISYEIVCAISRRVPRVYVRTG